MDHQSCRRTLTCTSHSCGISALTAASIAPPGRLSSDLPAHPGGTCDIIDIHSRDPFFQARCPVVEPGSAPLHITNSGYEAGVAFSAGFRN